MRPENTTASPKAGCGAIRSWLERSDVLRLGAFLAFRDVEFDFLVFFKGAVSRRLDRAEVSEDVSSAIIGGDEPITFIGVEPFHGSGCHVYS